MGFLVKILWQTVAIAAVQRAVNYGIKRYTKTPDDQLFTLTISGTQLSLAKTTHHAATLDELTDKIIGARALGRPHTVMVKRDGLHYIILESPSNG